MLTRSDVSRIVSLSIILTTVLAKTAPGQMPPPATPVPKTFSDNFGRLDAPQTGWFGGHSCAQRTTQVCLPSNCRIDLSKTYGGPSSQGGGSYAGGGPGYGVVVTSLNNFDPSGYGRYTLDPNTQCLQTSVNVCSYKNQRGWYEGHEEIYGICFDQKCSNCAAGSSFDPNRNSCVAGTNCGTLAGLPDGDKGGGYFASRGNLLLDTGCSPCTDLQQQPIVTAGGAWKVTSPGGQTSMPILTKPNEGWEDATGGWISLTPDNSKATGQAIPSGPYTYETTFCLCVGYSSPSLNLQEVLADNSIAVYLNGVLIGQNTSDKSFAGTPLSLVEQHLYRFWPGMNTLRFVVSNSGEGLSPSGLLVKGTISAVGGKCP